MLFGTDPIALGHHNAQIDNVVLTDMTGATISELGDEYTLEEESSGSVAHQALTAGVEVGAIGEGESVFVSHSYDPD